MRVLILHLSDIHLRSEDDYVLTRIISIADAARTTDYELDACVVVLSGDIASTGSETEYLIAAAFIGALLSELKAGLAGSVPIWVVSIPGNHDCDFAAPRPARDALIANLRAHPTDTVDPTTLSVCTDTQSHYFDFQDLVSSECATSGDRLYYEHDIVLNGERVQFRCLNTAWQSELQEKQGSLAYPVNHIPAGTTDAGIVITVMHHPYKWFTVHNSRALQKAVEGMSDIILTGHEHDFAARSQQGHRGETNLYVEGGALQERSGKSSFNALVLDTTLKLQRLIAFSFADGMYVRVHEDTDWRPFQANALRAVSPYALNVSFEAYLSDLGYVMTSPANELLKLADVFVDPDLREVSYDDSKPKRLIGSDVVLEKLADLKAILVTGPDKSGKTSLAKVYFHRLYGDGFVPVLLDAGTDELLDNDKIYGAVEARYAKQYLRPAIEGLRQLSSERRVVIVDNFHNLRLKKGSPRGVLRRLTRFAERVIVFSHDVSQHVADLARLTRTGTDELRVSHYQIQGHGHSRRAQLVEKWFALAPSGDVNPESYSRRLIETKQVIDVAVGHNFLPPYPSFILPILQAQYHSENVDVSTSTYGHLYELLIRRTLAVEATKANFDIYLSYLASLAQWLFVNRRQTITEQELRTLHADFEQQQLLRLKFVATLNEFTKRQVLEEAPGGYQFKYKYFYYYFVASYLRDHLDRADVRSTIEQLTQSLHEEDPANILLFLVHVTKSDFVIDQMLAAAGRVFPEAVPAALATSDSPLVNVRDTVIEVAYEEMEAQASRQQVFRTLDQEAEDSETVQTTDYLMEIGRAFKTQQIVGQIVKNFPGKIDGERKKQLTLACYGIGLRVLGSVTALVRDNLASFAGDILKTVVRDNPDKTAEEVSDKAIVSIFVAMHLATYGIIKRISYSVGSPHLGPVYEAVERDSEVPAIKLVHASLSMDQEPSFPASTVIRIFKEVESNVLVRSVLRSLVVNHFYLFDVRIQTKQQVCTELGIPIHRAISPDLRAKLLARPKGEG
jgi:hypothetical protein